MGKVWIMAYENFIGVSGPHSIRFAIHNWNELDWAHQTYYRAKYGVSGTGELELRIRELPLHCLAGGMTIPPLHGSYSEEIGVPDREMPGSNRRLRAIIEETRTSIVRTYYDDTGLLHTGPDHSMILTNAAGWGPICTKEPHEYVELDDGWTCHWEIDPATWCPDTPWWALPEIG